MVGIRDEVLPKLVKKRNVDIDGMKRLLQAHVEKLKKLGEGKKPRPGEAASNSLEEEFDEWEPLLMHCFWSTLTMVVN